MKIKKKYSFKSKRQIWRIIPTETNKLIIEEREPDKKQVYFNCFQTDTGKKIFKDLQLDEKFWVGIEKVYNDVIFFHKYLKPDMPGHKGIIALEIENEKIKWENKDLTFLFPLDDMIYTCAETFEGRNHFALDYKTGEVLEAFGNDPSKISALRERSIENENSKNYLFPNIYYNDINDLEELKSFFEGLKNKCLISGRIELIRLDSMLIFSYHGINSKGSMDIFFDAVDLSTGNYILEEKLMKETGLFLSDSFFIKGNLLFVLFGKSKLNVYELRD